MEHHNGLREALDQKLVENLSDVAQLKGELRYVESVFMLSWVINVLIIQGLLALGLNIKICLLTMT